MNFFIIELIHKFLSSSFIFYKIFLPVQRVVRMLVWRYIYTGYSKEVDRWELGWCNIFTCWWILLGTSAPVHQILLRKPHPVDPVPFRCHRSWMEGRKIIGKKLNAVFLFTAVVNIDQINKIVNLFWFGYSPFL